MSRGNSPLYGSSPLNIGGGNGNSSSQCSVTNINNNIEQPSYISGLSVLAKGYEQYRESLFLLRHTTEYGEASSDDLSSEWESSNESEASASKSGGSGQKSDQSSQIVT